jgi:lipopolysaccharide/colanic/teichoic acid biosynthesis glycosyltransferase
MTPKDRFIKRIFDLLMSIIGLGLFGFIIFIAIVVATFDTGRNGIFSQIRVGKNKKRFRVYKIRTMMDTVSFQTDVTTDNDPRITRIGKIFRKTKIDELPQLFNVLLGDMSFVGPRPDVPGFADKLGEEDKVLLQLRPGITGPATLFFRFEEKLLAMQSDPERYNAEVIYPQKVLLNKDYINNYSLWLDIKYIWLTLFPNSQYMTQNFESPRK